MGRISALTELTELASNDYLLVLDTSANIAKKISVANAFGIPDLGYTASGETWTYASATTITVPTNATTKYDKGMIVKFSQTTGGTKYAVITNVAATLLTVKLLNGATLANETISNSFYTTANPLGAGLKPTESLLSTVAFAATITQSIPNNSYTTLTGFSELFDKGSNFASGTFTAPYDGIYHFDVSIKIDNLSSGTTQGRVECNIEVNSTPVAYGHGWTTLNTYDPSATAGATVQLNAGDLVKISAYQQSNGSQTPGSGSTFSGHLIGRI